MDPQETNPLSPTHFSGKPPRQNSGQNFAYLGKPLSSYVRSGFGSPDCKSLGEEYEHISVGQSMKIAQIPNPSFMRFNPSSNHLRQRSPSKSGLSSRPEVISNVTSQLNCTPLQGEISLGKQISYKFDGSVESREVDDESVFSMEANYSKVGETLEEQQTPVADGDPEPSADYLSKQSSSKINPADNPKSAYLLPKKMYHFHPNPKLCGYRQVPQIQHHAPMSQGSQKFQPLQSGSKAAQPQRPIKALHNPSSTSSQRLIGSLCNNTPGGFRANLSLTTSHQSEDKSTEDQTDPNSLYRQKYSNDLSFYLWAIDRFEYPIQFKMHLEHSKKQQAYISDKQFLQSTHSFIRENTNTRIPQSDITIRRYSRKNQIKIFLTLNCGKDQAKEVFALLHSTPSLPVRTRKGILQLKMLAYVVRKEQEFVELAKIKFEEDNNCAAQFDNASRGAYSGDAGQNSDLGSKGNPSSYNRGSSRGRSSVRGHGLLHHRHHGSQYGTNYITVQDLSQNLQPAIYTNLSHFGSQSQNSDIDQQLNNLVLERFQNDIFNQIDESIEPSSSSKSASSSSHQKRSRASSVSNCATHLSKKLEFQYTRTTERCWSPQPSREPPLVGLGEQVFAEIGRSVNPSLNMNLKIKASEEKKEECNDPEGSEPVGDGEVAEEAGALGDKLEILETKKTRYLTVFQKRAVGVIGTPNHFHEN